MMLRRDRPDPVGLSLERYVACMRCAVKHPDQAATPLAAYGAFAEPWEVDRLWSLARGKVGRAPGHRAVYNTLLVREPLAESPGVAVALRCRRCGLVIGPISAKRVGQLFAEGADDQGVLLLPQPAAGMKVPSALRVSLDATARASGR
jgi:hypothetical protein